MAVTAERPAPVARLLEELRALERAYSPGHHGRWSAGRRAELVDACLIELFESADVHGGVALVALGGYGRGRLSPFSDVDLLIVHDGSHPDAVAALAERILYPLWDAGLRVGHGVRTPLECEALAAERLDARTAMLDGRALAGDAVPWTDATARVAAPVRVEPRAFAEALREDADRRRERHGSVSGLLEPELKEGAGGLRDVQVLGWLQAAVGGPLERLGLLRSAERERVDEADEFLERTRSALHLATGRATDVIVLEQQSQVARDLGFVDEPDLAAVDGLMRSLFEHARQVEHVTRSVLDRYLRGPDDVPDVEPTTAGILRTFATFARRGEVMPAATLDAVAAIPQPDPIEWTPEVRDAFLDLLAARPDGVRALETLDRIGLLTRLLPAWRAVRCRPQRDPYHRSAVDVHLLGALENVSRLLESSSPADPLVAEAVTAVRDPNGLRLGALLHDIGKTGSPGHVARGAAIASEALDPMGLPEPTRDLARFLVSEHLLLSDTATRRDLEDEDLVHDVAARVGTPERLAALYLLTIADAEATGPLAWTPWRATLVRELLAKVERVLERGEVGADTAALLTERADALRSALASEPPENVDRFLLRMPRSYLLGLPVERIVEQFPLVTPRLAAHEVRAHAVAGDRPGTHVVTVVAEDRPGLLSQIAGALALAGLSILTAQVFTTDDGVAVDVFEVEGAFEEEVAERRWREFRGTLRKAIEGRLSLPYRVEQKRAHYPVPRHRVPVRVAVDNEASDFFTVIEVGATDRIGVLFDITRTFAELRLDVHLAKVATYGARVVDAFYLRDDLGRKVEDGDRIAELENALRARLAIPD
ncbi:MAG TPA: ACT domain-containing protein [Actinomycetota bacterium]|nr:ACT domain-containing protein [Actinomycetota bacterium]